MSKQYQKYNPSMNGLLEMKKISWNDEQKKMRKQIHIRLEEITKGMDFRAKGVDFRLINFKTKDGIKEGLKYSHPKSKPHKHVSSLSQCDLSKQNRIMENLKLRNQLARLKSLRGVYRQHLLDCKNLQAIQEDVVRKRDVMIIHNSKLCCIIIGYRMLKVLAAKTLYRNFFCSGKVKYPDIPQVTLPERLGVPNEDRVNKYKYYETMNYKMKERPPRCRYYSFQYRNRIYHFFDAYYYPMGRMINRVATAIRGKNSPHYRNNMAQISQGDICVIVNAEDPLFTGKKLLFKNLKYHTNFVGHLKSFSYKSILNRKPQLLYFYLLRKAMPKNRLSQKYLKNVKLYRGPTHDIAHLPQFAPDQNIYEALPEIDFRKYVLQTPGIKLQHAEDAEAAEKIFGKKFDVMPENQQVDQYDNDDPTQLYEPKEKKKKTLKYSQKQFEKIRRKQKRLRDRYKAVRAPYKKKKGEQRKSHEYFDSERKAKRSKYYEILKDQQAPEEDDFSYKDPFNEMEQFKSKKNQGSKKDSQKKL